MKAPPCGGKHLWVWTIVWCVSLCKRQKSLHFTTAADSFTNFKGIDTWSSPLKTCILSNKSANHQPSTFPFLHFLIVKWMSAKRIVFIFIYVHTVYSVYTLSRHCITIFFFKSEFESRVMSPDLCLTLKWWLFAFVFGVSLLLLKKALTYFNIEFR